MFVNEQERDNTVLRQGDILRDVIFPVLRSADVLYYVAATQTETGMEFKPHTKTDRDVPMFKALFPARIGFAAVISMCCDLEPHNGHIQQPTFALARLTRVPSGIVNDPERYEKLRLNTDPRKEPEFLNFFYVPPRPALDDTDWIVNFSSVFCLPEKEYPAIMSRKILQMDDDHRIRFKVRLASSFGRFTPEEADSGHPWIAEYR
jgi:hypothetical protein